MPTQHFHAKNFIKKLSADAPLATILARIQPTTDAAPQRAPTGNTADAFTKRWEMVNLSDEAKSHLTHANSVNEMQIYTKNIENFFGTVKIPIGLAVLYVLMVYMPKVIT